MTRLAKKNGWTALFMLALSAARADQLSDDLNRNIKSAYWAFAMPFIAGFRSLTIRETLSTPGAAPAWEIYGGVVIDKLNLKKDELGRT